MSKSPEKIVNTFFDYIALCNYDRAKDYMVNLLVTYLPIIGLLYDTNQLYCLLILIKVSIIL